MYDLILKGGLVVDGTRSAPYIANVCVADGKIARITSEEAEAKEVLDVTGLAVAPGFIDPHSHSDDLHLRGGTLESQLAQGVTTEIMGNCGTCVMPALEESFEQVDSWLKAQGRLGTFLSVTDYAEAGNAKGSCINYGALLGHSNLRVAVMGYVNRDPNPEEMEKLKALLEREMQRGAFGMSLGLIYPPSAFSAREELVELSKVIAKYDGILAVHMRNEGPKLFEAVDEMIDIAEKSGVHIQISHLKLMGTPQWGRSPELLEKLEAARAKGLNITCDQYPFTASSTSLSALVPHWAHEGGKAELVKRLQNDDGTILADMQKEMDNRGGSDAVLVVTTARQFPQWEGKTLTQLGAEFGLSPIEAAKKVLIDCGATCSCVYFSMNEADMLRIMEKRFICVGSDGGSISHDPTRTVYIPHPRYFAAFVRFFQTVREHNLMPLEDAVYKVTALPASILGIKDRGILAEGMAADIAVFDPATIGSKATFLESRVWPDGVHHVIVNGQVALRNGAGTGIHAGKTILKEV